MELVIFVLAFGLCFFGKLAMEKKSYLDALLALVCGLFLGALIGGQVYELMLAYEVQKAGQK